MSYQPVPIEAEQAAARTAGPAPRPRLPEPAGGTFRMTSDVVTTGTPVRVLLGGEIDQDSSHELRRTLEAALRYGDVEVDMAKVVFCDGAGLDALLEVRETAVTLGRSLTVCAGDSRIRHLLEVTGLLPVLWSGRAASADGASDGGPR
jgi:anti-anti-sigma factor